MRKDGYLDTIWSSNPQDSAKMRTLLSSTNVPSVLQALEGQKQSDLEMRLPHNVMENAASILSLKDEYKTRPERIRVLGLLEGIGYSVAKGYGDMADHQLSQYFSAVMAHVLSEKQRVDPR